MLFGTGFRNKFTGGKNYVDGMCTYDPVFSSCRSDEKAGIGYEISTKLQTAGERAGREIPPDNSIHLLQYPVSL